MWTRIISCEAAVLALTREDYAGGSAVRRWLDEDEYLIRRRVHRDMKQALAGERGATGG